MTDLEDHVTLLPPSVDTNSLPRYISVEGPIGVGKTTLAQKLADTFQYQTLFEGAAANPFLPRFYRDPKRFALATQLSFLLERARQLTELKEGDMHGATVVADFLIEKDRLFAELTLDAHELDIYQQIYDSLDIRPPTPDLVLYLQAPVDILHRRIRSRGVATEQRMDTDYLRELSESYARFFHSYRDAPLLIVNAAEIDFAHNRSHYEALLEQVLTMDGTVRYFNPHPTLL